MRAYLHHAFRVTGNKLLDDELSSSYTLTPDAAWLAGRLQHGRQVGQLAGFVQQERKLSDQEALRGVLELLAQLEVLGAIKWEPKGVLDRLNLLWFSSGRRKRYPLTLTGSIRALAHAYLPVALLLTAPYGLLVWQVRATEYLWLFVLLPVMMLLTFAMHEWGHMVAARRYKVRAVFLVGTGYMAVVYGRVAPRAMRNIAVAGPVLAVASCILLAICAPLLIIKLLFLAVAVVHGLHLLPYTADGNIIWRRT